MTGGYHSARQHDRDRTLAQRIHPDGPTGAATDPAESAPLHDPKPCWLQLDPTAQPVPGHVLAWVTPGAGRWRAVVVIEVDAAEVRARDPDDPV